MTRIGFACWAAAAVLLLGASASDVRAQLHDAATAYLANVAAMARITGRDTAMDYYIRLTQDGDNLDEVDAPGSTYNAMQRDAVRQTTALDLDLVHQLLRGTYRPMGDIRGLGETLVRSSKDGTMQAVAVYVPSGYVPGKPTPLLVFLHGNPQSETSLLSPSFVHDLAERTGTIVVAPYGRGYYDYRGSVSDVYDAVDAAKKAFTIDGRRHYLAGYSMGGFSVFEVAPAHPNDWAAVMCIAGALLGHDADRLVASMRLVPFYVLTGTADDSIPTEYPTITAAFLRTQGMDVSFYSEAGGLHRLSTLLPILTQAWTDMHAGIVRQPPPNLAVNIKLPTAIPTTVMKI